MADSTVRSLLGAFLGANRRNATALVVVAGFVALAVLVPHWTTRYGAALAVFSVWMAWFVESLAAWLGEDGTAAGGDAREDGTATGDSVAREDGTAAGGDAREDGVDR